MTPTNPPKEPLDQRMVTMVTKTHRAQLDAASRLPGFRGEAQVVRYCLDQILPQLLDDAAPKRSYAGRTRILVDTAEPALEPDEDREKRVGTARPPARLRGPVAPPEKVPSAPVYPESSTWDAPEAAPLHDLAISGARDIVEAFDGALESLGFDPERIAIAGQPQAPAAGEVCLECFCVQPHHASTCTLASDSASA